MNRLLTTAAEAAPEAGGTGGMTMLIVIAVACVGFGIFLLVAKKEALERSRLLTGGRMKMDKVSLDLTRMTGVQMIAIGVLLLVGIVCINQGFVLAGLLLLLGAVLLPIPFTIYRKNSSRFK